VLSSFNRFVCAQKHELEGSGAEKSWQLPTWQSSMLQVSIVEIFLVAFERAPAQECNGPGPETSCRGRPSTAYAMPHGAQPIIQDLCVVCVCNWQVQRRRVPDGRLIAVLAGWLKGAELPASASRIWRRRLARQLVKQRQRCDSAHVPQPQPETLSTVPSARPVPLPPPPPPSTVPSSPIHRTLLPNPRPRIT